MDDEVLAVFANPDAAARALEALGPIALGGALTGLAAATALQVVTSEHLGLVVGGKPIVAWPAFGVIMFELTMLFGGVATFASLAVLSALARRGVPARARQAVGSEEVVVVVPLGGGAPSRADVEAVLRGARGEVR